MAPTHSRCALVSVNYHHYWQLLSRNHLHHGLLGATRMATSFQNGGEHGKSRG